MIAEAVSREAGLGVYSVGSVTAAAVAELVEVAVVAEGDPV